MSYEYDLAEVKAEAINDGVTRQQFEEWRCLMDDVARSCGFASASDVRRVANKFGHINRW